MRGCNVLEGLLHYLLVCPIYEVLFKYLNLSIEQVIGYLINFLLGDGSYHISEKVACFAFRMAILSIKVCGDKLHYSGEQTVV